MAGSTLPALVRLSRGGLRLFYPPQCIRCETFVDQTHALCPPCWRETPFITGLVCDSCGDPLPGSDDGPVLCDSCLRFPPPWDRGRAAFVYDGVARDLILRLKHGDRLDLAKPLGDWLAQAAAPILSPETILAPVPLHWRRLARRRYNQSALLAQRMARQLGTRVITDLLQRARATESQDGKTRGERHANLAGAFRVAPRRLPLIQGAHVAVIDDVLTSGATMAEATRVLKAAGAARVSVVALARVSLPERINL